MILCDDANVLGHLIFRYTNSDRNTIRFGFVIVDSSRRGEGLGVKMLDLASDFAFNILGATKITLGVFENNVSAFHCYKKAKKCCHLQTALKSMAIIILCSKCSLSIRSNL